MSTVTVKDGTTIYYKDWGSGPVVTWPFDINSHRGRMIVDRLLDKKGVIGPTRPA